MIPIPTLDNLYNQILKARKAEDHEKEQSLIEDYASRVDELEPTYIGPTWKKRNGKWVLPERTLGWDIIGWMAEYLESPAKANTPLELTSEQMRFLLWWYAVDDTGAFSYRGGVLQRLKGWG